MIGLITLKKVQKKSKEKHLWRHIFLSQGTADIFAPRDGQDRRVTWQGPLIHLILSYLLVFLMVNHTTSLYAHQSSDFIPPSGKFLVF